jgi:hypothetical protein
VSLFCFAEAPSEAEGEAEGSPPGEDARLSMSIVFSVVKNF